MQISIPQGTTVKYKMILHASDIKYHALVSGDSFDEDKASVITFCKEFYGDVTTELNRERTPNLIGYCEDYEGPIRHIFFKE